MDLFTRWKHPPWRHSQTLNSERASSYVGITPFVRVIGSATDLTPEGRIPVQSRFRSAHLCGVSDRLDGVSLAGQCAIPR